MPNFDNLREIARQHPDPVVREEQMRKLDKLAKELPDIERRIAELKQGDSGKPSFFSVPAFLLGLLIVAALVFSVFSGLPKGASAAVILLAALIGGGVAYLHFRRRMRQLDRDD